MFPNLALADGNDVHVRNAEFFGKTNRWLIASAANDANIILGEFCSTVRRSSWMAGALLPFAVQDVFSGRTSDEMARIAARRIVTGVTNVLVGSKFAVEKLVGKAMRFDIAPILADVTVSLRSAGCTEPRPTRVGSARSIES